MRLYQTHIPSVLLKLGTHSDHLSLICSRAWEVLNDEGIKQVLIFRGNGDLFISTNGVVSNGSWTRVSDDTIILSSPEGSRMLHPIYRDDVIFGLQQDGTDDILFLINKERITTDFPSSDEAVQDYFNSLEENLVLEEERRRLEEDRRGAEKEAERIKWSEEHANKFAEQKKQNDLRNKAINETKWVKSLITTLIVSQILALLVFIILGFAEVIDGHMLFAFSSILGVAIVNLVCYKESIVTYFIDRYTALRLDIFSALTQRIKRKSLFIRLFGWMFAYASTIIVALNSQITLDEPWYIVFGFQMGLFLGFAFWVWIGRVLSRRYELKTIGRKL